jgi:hypothetical protein
MSVGSNKTIYLCFHSLPVPMAARITKYLNRYVRRGICLIYMLIFLFLEPSVCQKNTKNQYAVLPGISVRVLASHFSSVIGNFRSSGWLDLHVWYLKTFVNASAWYLFPVDHYIGPVEQVRSKKPWSGRSKLPAVQPLWLNFRPLPVSRIAWHTCIIPQNVCTCLCFINIYSKTVYTSLDWRK